MNDVLSFPTRTHTPDPSAVKDAATCTVIDFPSDRLEATTAIEQQDSLITALNLVMQNSLAQLPIPCFHCGQQTSLEDAEMCMECGECCCDRRECRGQCRCDARNTA